jgi:CRP-like cAMP-binding protein
MSVIQFLQQSELFSGLTPQQVEQVSALGREAVYNAGDVVLREGDPSDEMYIVCHGSVEVEVSRGRIPDSPGPPQFTSLARLGEGQLFGEMALVDRGVRSATVRCIQDDTVLCAIPRQALLTLCDSDHDIGYVVMRNIASDLSFKLRHRNLRTRLAGGDR